MTSLLITNDICQQIALGKHIFRKKQSVYADLMVQTIKDCINRCYSNFKRKDLSKEDIFFISIYDYWTVGCTVAESLYYHFIDKTFEQKKSFITLRDRLIYTDRLNHKEDSHLLTNKYEAYEILKPLYKREVIRIQDESDYAIFKDFVSRHPKFVAKPEGASMSLGVHLVNTDNSKSLNELFRELIKEGIESRKICNWCDCQSVVCEEIIEQTDIMKSLHPASINNLRVITIRQGECVSIFYPCVKIGMNNEFICSGASGSIIAAVDPQTGKVTTNGKTEILTEYEFHPNTNIPIRGFQIPEWDEMLDVLKQAALKFPTLSLIGWDVVHSTKGWCIMEGNYATEFVCCQLPYQMGFRDRFEGRIGFSLDREKLWWQ